MKPTCLFVTPALGLGLFLGAASLAAQGTARPRDLEIEVIRLAEDVYLFRAPSDMDKWTSSNSVAVLSDEGVVVFDTNTLPSTSRLVLGEIQRLTDQPVRMLINSHWHMDHWSGNEVYADAFPGLQIIATFKTRDFMSRMPAPFFMRSVGLEGARQRLQEALDTGQFPDGTEATDDRLAEARSDVDEREVFQAEVSATRRVLPTLMFADSLAFSIGGRDLRLYSMTGDAAGSTVLYLPEEEILVTGDVLVRQESGGGAQPWTMNSFAVSEWLESLRRLESFDAAVIVPGQGPALRGSPYLRATRELYEALISQTHTALETGTVGVSNIQGEVDVEDFRTRFELDSPELNRSFDAVVSALVRKIVQEAYDGAVPRG